MSEPGSQKLRKLTSEEDVLKLLECPVCFQVPFPPIFLCANGHNICKFCKVKLVECPTCKGKFLDVRNRTIEDIVLATKHACPYSKEGCKIEEIGGSIENHITTCGYRPIMCPKKGLHDCDRNVLHLSEAIDHFLNGHKSQLVAGPSATIKRTINIANMELQQKPSAEFSSWPVTLIEFDGICFLAESFTHQGMVFWFVSYIGEENDTKRYRVKIICQPGQKVEMQWSVPVYSIHKSSVHRKASTEMTGNSVFTPSCRLQDLKQTLGDNDGEKYTISTQYLLSKVEEDTDNGK